MVQRIQEIVAKYEGRLREMQSVPRLSYGRRLVRKEYRSFLREGHRLGSDFF